MSSIKIIGLAGKMQAGKTTSAHLIKEIHRQKEIDCDVFSLADELKRFCIENEWVTNDQAYGTNDDKNSLTHLRWENMPDIIIKNAFEFYQNQNNGYMTAREVLQHIGTNIFRRMDNNIWINKCFKNIEEHIQEEALEVAIIDDLRFSNEVMEIKDRGGIAIFLTRNPFNNNHVSEIELDNFDKSNYDYIIDNSNFSLDELKGEIKSIFTN